MSYSQGIDPLTIDVPSSNAISLGSYIECPVSPFTGLPQIEIPIYEYSGKSISGSISLSYHAAGLRPELHPGWVGSGWTLNAGGAITRVIKGLRDDLNTPLKKGFIFSNKSILSSFSWASQAVLSDPFSYHGYIDWIADEFYFNFMGISGMFFLDNNGVWRVKSDQPLEVVVVTDASNFILPYAILNGYSINVDENLTKAINKFTIIDSKGTKYTFGGPDAIEYSDQIYPKAFVGDCHNAMTWYLTKVETANGDEVVNFCYERGPFTSMIHKTVFELSILASDGKWKFLNLDPGCDLWNGRRVVNGQIVSPVYLKSIDFPLIDLIINFSTSKSNDLKYSVDDYSLVLGKDPMAIDFLKINEEHVISGIPYFTNNPIPDDKEERFIWLKLNNIDIINSKSNELSKRIGFKYNEYPTKRLELSSLDFYDKNIDKINNYEFYYNTTPLPNYLESITDHWGFNNNTAFPDPLLKSNIETYREPNPDYVQAGILTSIKYPTKGTVTFEYEPNRYHYYVNNSIPQLVIKDGTTGGVRIKRIITDDGIGNQLVKQYFYVENYTPNSNPSTLTPTGILEVKPKYINEASGVDEDNLPFTYYFASSNPVIPLSNTSSGRFIGYYEVAEVQPDSGYTIYKFTSQKTGYYDSLPIASHNPQFSFVQYFTDRDNERGRLASKCDYNSDGAKVREEIFSYSPLGLTTNLRAKTLEQSGFQVCDNSAARFCFTRTAIYKNYYKVPLKQKTVNYYNPVTSELLTSNTEYYAYNHLGLLSEQSKVLSNSDMFITRNKYSSDYTSDYTSNLAQICYDAYDDCIAGCVHLDPDCSSPCLIEFSDCLENIPESTPETNTILNMQNRFITGQLIEQQHIRRKGNIDYFLQGLLFKYQTLNNKILPLEILELNANSPLTSLDFSYINETNSSFTYSPLYVTSVKYDNFDADCNILQYHKENNYNTSFIWESDQNPVAKVINATYPEIAYTGFEENGVFGGWTYQSGTRVSTFSKTGKYSGANSIMQKTVSVNSIVSLWAKTGSGTVTITGYTPKIYAATDGWTYYEWNVNPGLITVNCTNGYIDDLRLYPVGAMMSTYTYNPLDGMTSMTDHNGIITRYEYDSFGRLKNVRDNDGKITARNYYHYYNDPSSDTPFLNTSPTSLAFGSGSSSSTFSISSNCTWSITDNASWLSVNTTSGTGYATISATVTTNTGAARNATITITYSGGLTKTVSVSQAACSSTLTVNPVYIDFGSIAPTVTVTVTSNTSWTVTKSDWWIRLSATSGTGNGTVGIGAAELPSEFRTGTVTFKTTDNTVTRIIQITQVSVGLQEL